MSHNIDPTHDEKTLYTPDGDVIPWFDKKLDNYVDRTTLILGGTSSGKTFLTTEILHTCKDYIPNIIVIAPEGSQKFYRGKIPDKCIKEDLTKKMLINIWTRQQEASEIYNTANDAANLESLFKKTSDREGQIVIEAIIRGAQGRIKRIEAMHDIPYDQKKSAISKIKDRMVEEITRQYKIYIRKNKEKLKTLFETLSLPEKITLEYLDFNPRLMLIIDDKTECLDKYFKYFKKGQEENIFEQIFFRGRHNFITLIIAAHSDEQFKPAFRQNARVIYYTTTKALISSMAKPGSGYSSSDKKTAQRIANYILGDAEQLDSRSMNFKKLCYVQGEKYNWQYTVADKYPDFTLGCRALYDMTKLFPDKKHNLQNNSMLQHLIPEKSTKKSKRPINYVKRSSNKKY